MLRVKGVNELSKALKKAATLDDVKEVVKMNGSELQRRMHRKAPVDTAFMKRSIDLDVIDKGFAAKVTPTAHYSYYVELGTRYMYAQPFVRPSLKEQEKQFIKDLNRLMK